VYTLFVVLHLTVCVFLIFVVLIQSSKGAELGAAFGGSNQTLFGSRGAATFMNKLTTGTAVAFMLTSLTLAVLSFDRGSVIPDNIPARESASPLPETTSGPLQGEPVAPGQGEVQGTPDAADQSPVKEIPAAPAE
jgi:preprotein translocase subunit SecG